MNVCCCSITLLTRIHRIGDLLRYTLKSHRMQSETNSSMQSLKSRLRTGFQILILILGLLNLYHPVRAQQLVTNGDFESYNKCPVGYSCIDAWPNFPYLQSWVRPTLATSDFYHTCGSSTAKLPATGFGYRTPHSGNAFAGLVANAQTSGSPYSEYITTRLNQPMKKDSVYCVKFYCNLGNRTNPSNDWVAVDEVGACFTDTLPGNLSQAGPLLLPYHIVNSPTQHMTDTSLWYAISGQYKAKGGEQWMTIGTFGSAVPASTLIDGTGTSQYLCYYFIDDVSVGTLKDSVHHVMLCSKLMTLTSSYPTGPYKWGNGAKTRSIVVTSPGTYQCQVGLDCGIISEYFEVTAAPVNETTDSVLVCDTGNISVVLTSPQAFGPYEWSTGDTTRSIYVTSNGAYYCDVLKNCVNQRTRFLLRMELIHAPVVRDTVICQNTPNPQLLISDSNLRWYTQPIAGVGSSKQPTINTSNAGVKTLYVSRAERGCESPRLPIRITILAAPKKQWSPELVVRCLEDSVREIHLGSDDGIEANYQWNTGDTVCCIVAGNDRSYVRIRENGCGAAEDYFQVRTERCENCVGFPDAFTPNNDGRNDRFRPFVRCSVTDYQIRICNRWGNTVFYSEQPLDGWDGSFHGEPVMGGVYMYYASFTSSLTGMKYVVKGDVTVVW